MAIFLSISKDQDKESKPCKNVSPKRRRSVFPSYSFIFEIIEFLLNSISVLACFHYKTHSLWEVLFPLII